MFNPDIKCDYINNNLVECFNAWVRDVKDLPIVQLADKIREMIMDLFRKRRMIGERFYGKILPFVIHQLFKQWWEGGSRKGTLNKCKKCGEVGHREAGCPTNGTKKR